MVDVVDIETIITTINSEVGTGNGGASISGLLRLAGTLGIDMGALQTEVVGLLRERILLWLIGDVRTDLGFSERRQVVLRRLKVLSPALSALHLKSDVVTRLAEFQAAIAEASRLPTRETLSRIDEVTCFDVLSRQGFRCAVCGIPVRERARRGSNRFPGSKEPVVRPTLEHRLPYYLVGNVTDYEILCLHCNRTKHDRVGLQEDGFVLAGNFLRRHETDRVATRTAFWTLWRHRRCICTGCQWTSADGVLFVERVSPRSPFSLDNLRPVCEEHASDRAIWLHAGRAVDNEEDERDNGA
jgi:hypothetical protein